jgi:membrane-associated protease RseP (regulator of RpoE activity)
MRQGLWMSAACAAIAAAPALAGSGAVTVHAKEGGDGPPEVHVTGATNISTKVVVQTVGPNGMRSVQVFNCGGAGQADGAAPAVTWLGVTTEAASDELRAQLSLDPGVGLTVFGVAPDGPAAKAGLQVHDVLTRFGDQILMDPDQLKNLVRAKKAGDRATLAYLRKGQAAAADVILGEHAEPSADALHVINLGDFSVDVNQLMRQMPQIQRQISGAVSGVSTSFSFSIGEKSGGGLPVDAEAILKNLKFDDTNVSRMVNEAVRKALKDASIETEK